MKADVSPRQSRMQNFLSGALNLNSFSKMIDPPTTPTWTRSVSWELSFRHFACSCHHLAQLDIAVSLAFLYCRGNILLLLSAFVVTSSVLPEEVSYRMLELNGGQFRWPFNGFVAETGFRHQEDWHLSRRFRPQVGAQASRVFGARTIREDGLASSRGRSGNLAAGRGAGKTIENFL